MKKIMAILSVSLLIACILHGHILSNILHKDDPYGPKEPVKAPAAYARSFFIPVSDHQPLLTLNPQYHYSGSTFSTVLLPVRTNVLLVRGRTTFRKGNTFFLFPHSFVLPLQSPESSLTLPKN